MKLVSFAESIIFHGLVDEVLRLGLVLFLVLGFQVFEVIFVEDRISSRLFQDLK